MDELINKYIGQERVPSVLCCFTMLLYWVGDTEGLEAVTGRFTTITGAKRVLPKILNHKDLDSYMLAHDVSIIENWRYLQDGDLLVIDGVHSHIFQAGYLFGLSSQHAKTFNYIPLNTVIECLSQKQTMRVYRKN